MASDNRERIADLKAQGLTVREIAKVLDITTQGVYWHLHRLDREQDTKRGAA